MLANRARRRMAFGLRRAGVFLMSLSVIGAVAHAPLPLTALAQQWDNLQHIVAQALPPIALPTATPSPSPAPTVRPLGHSTAVFGGKQIDRGGPLTFSISGSLALGEREFQDTHAGSLAGSQVTTSQSQSTQTAGLLFQVERRTPLTTLSLGLPAGVSMSRRSTFGQLQASYYTPHYGLQYMPVSLSVLGGIPVGFAQDAYSLVLPLHGGDLTVVGGPTLLDKTAAARLYGVRGRTLLGSDLVEFGLFDGRSLDGSQHVDSALAGFAGVFGKLNQTFEAAYQRSRDSSAPVSGFGYEYRGDYGGGSTYTTLTLQHTSDGFLSIGSGALRRQQQESIGFHAGAMSLNELVEDQGVGSEATLTRQGSLAYNASFGKREPVETQFTLSDQRTVSEGSVTWLGGAGLQAAATIRDVDVLFGLQSTRQTETGASPTVQMSYEGAVQKQFGDYGATWTYQLTHQKSAGTFEGVSEANFSLQRQWGLTSLGFSTPLTHTTSPTTNAFQFSPTINISRRISPVIALTLNVGEQIVRDTLNPSSNSRTRIFNLQVTTPFSIGNGIVQGRSNPRLPATIVGQVINDVIDQGPLNSAISNGIGDVVVVLDNTQIQRTDLSGRFQFNFVQPGHHTLEVQLASLPRGVTPDQPVESVDVEGGQQGQVIFALSTYGAVRGYVMGKDSDGQVTPLSGVVLSIDKGLQVTTGSDGAYGFGRLTPGSHTISVLTESLPATVSFPAGGGAKKVIVQNGVITNADFVANGLGSISGTVLFGKELSPQLTGPVVNAYVVAEPGDYAAITNDDGSYLLDNMPPGTYTVDVDPETVPADTGNAQGPRTVTVASGAGAQGINFTLGHKMKAVVFTLQQTETPATMYLQENALPPGGATEVAVDAPSGTTGVTAYAFTETVHLKYDKSRNKWVGMIDVPLQTRAATYAVKASVEGRHKSQVSANLRVDPGIALATFQISPRNAPRGAYVEVRGRFLADVHTGDKIHWLDGQLTTLSHKLTGRVFEFTVKISVQPMRGFLVTRQGELPITLR